MNSSLYVGLTCVAYLLPVALLVYQIWCNVDHYLRSPPVFLRTSALRGAPALPPVSVCISIPFDPVRLLDLGLNISGAKDEREVEEAVLNLRGIDQSMTMRQLAEVAGWRLAAFVKEVRLDNELHRYSLGSSSPRKSLPSIFEASSGPAVALPPPSSKKSALSHSDSTSSPSTFDSPSGAVRSLPFLASERSTVPFSDTTTTDRYAMNSSPVESCLWNTSRSRLLSSDSRPQHWQRSFFLWGTCFTFTPPPEVTSYHIGVRENLGYECILGIVFLDCSDVSTICDMPCAWAKFVLYFRYIFLVDMTSDTYSLRNGNIFQASSSLTYAVKPLDLILLDRSKTPETFLSRLRTFCNPFPSGRRCAFHEGMAFDTTIKDACKAAMVSEDCPGTGLSVRHRQFALPHKSRQWKTLPTKCRGVIQRSNHSTVALKEIRIYPLESLLADIAGSVGLYLGISFLTCFACFGKLICDFLAHAHTCIASTKYKRLVRCLMAWVSYTRTERLFKMMQLCILCFLLSVHAVLLLQGWMKYTEMPSVSIALKAQTSNVSGVPLEDKTLVAGHFSVRSLRCQLYPKYHKCLQTCLLRGRVDLDVLKVISTRVLVEDLPLCRDFQRPRVQYVVPESVWAMVDNPGILHCSEQCQQKHSKEIESEKFVYKIKAFAPSDGIKLVCGFGGIVGIYLGYSCLHALQYLLHRLKDWKPVIKWSAKLPSRLKSLTTGSVQLLLVGLVIVFFVIRAHLYLFEQPVSSYKKTNYLPTSELPTVTVCRWPPFNPFRLAAVIEEGTFPHMSPYGRYDFVEQLIENLPGNSSLKPQQFLEHISWSLNETILRFKSCSAHGVLEDFRDYWTTTATIFGRCYTFLPKVTSHCVDNKQFTVFFHPRPEHMLGVDDQVITTLHEKGIQPAVGAISKLNRPFKYVTHEIANVAFRMGTTGEEPYGTCVSRCLARQLSEKFDCRLPFDMWQKDLLDCGYPNLKAFLLALWNSTKYPLSGYETILGSEIITKCKSECWNTKHKMYAIHRSTSSGNIVVEQLSSAIKSGNNVHRGRNIIKVTTNFLEEEKDAELFPLAQMLSEVGGVAGSLLGVSLFSLLTWALSQFGSQ